MFYSVQNSLLRQVDFLSLSLWHLSRIGRFCVWGNFLSLPQRRSSALYNFRILGRRWFSVPSLEAGGSCLLSVQGTGWARFLFFPPVAGELFLEWVRWRVVEHLLILPQGQLVFIGVLESGHPRHQVGFMFVPQGQTLTTLYIGRAESRDGPLQIYPLHPQILADPVDLHQREGVLSSFPVEANRE